MNFDFLKYHKEVISCTFQSLIGYICLVLVFSITCHFSALYLGPIYFSGVSLAFSVLGMLIIPLVYAFNQTMNINVAQAMGNGDQLLSLKYLNITLYTHLFIHCFIGAIVYFCLELFKSFVKESSEQIMAATKEIYIYLLISQFVFAIYETFKLYLIANKRYTPFKYIHVTTTLLHWVWCDIFIVHLQLGLFGLGLATIITQLTNLLLLAIYSQLYCIHHFQSFTCDFIIFKQIDFYAEYLRNSLSNIAQVMADFVIYGVMDVLSFQLGMKDMNVQLVFKNTSTLFYKLPQCAAIAMQTYIGTELGQGNIEKAKIYAQVGFIQFSLIFPTLLCSLFIMRQEWAEFYSSSEIMKNLMIQDLPYYLFGFELFNGFQGFLSGILKGVEKFDLVSISTTSAFYLIAFPLMILSTYLNLGIDGLWCGFGCAVAVLCGIYSCSLYQLDWNVQSKAILQKINDSKLLINFV